MYKIVVRFFLVSLLITSVHGIAGCSSAPEKPENADEITANLLQAVIDVDFERYRSYFAEDIRDQLGTENDFSEEVTMLKDTYGEYVADSFSYLISL